MSEDPVVVELPVSYVEEMVNDTDWRILEELHRSSDRLEMKEIGESVGRAKSTVSESLSRLEDHGLVERSSPENGDRPVLFELANPEMLG